MSSDAAGSTPERVRGALAAVDPGADPAATLEQLIRLGLDRLPLPGTGATIDRWRALAAVAEHDLSLAKLYEGHTDALAIMSELGELGELGEDRLAPLDQGAWCVWAAESAQGRTLIEPLGDDRVRLDGRKFWCSGAGKAHYALLTAWYRDGRGPQLVYVRLGQPGIAVDSSNWHAVGMAASASLTVQFDGARGRLVGQPGEYLSRPGFWHGGAGIAACWFGGARGLAGTLRRSIAEVTEPGRRTLQLCALGKVELAMASAAAVVRESGRWIDDHPAEDAIAVALRARLVTDEAARRVLDETGRALGATPFCRDARFARAAADLPVFLRQSHAERDCVSLAERLLSADRRPLPPAARPMSSDQRLLSSEQRRPSSDAEPWRL